jgi:UDP-D-galactose:(glucosyl)LPS alpha-1,6-D-galactosyltransferase
MSLFVRRAVQSLGIPTKVVSWLHQFVENYQRAGFGGYDALQMADAHLAISEEIRQSVEKNIANAPVYRVYNPVVFPCDTKCMETGTGLSHKLLFVGRISAEKNIPLLVRSIAMLDQWKLYIVGDAEQDKQKQDILSLIEKHNVSDRVKLLGWKDDPWECVDDIDALVMASRYEAFPLVMIEANARGIPVISTKVNGATEYIRDGVNGFLYDLDDAQGLAHILREISLRGYVVPDRKNCKEMAKPYEKNRAFYHMYKILRNI